MEEMVILTGGSLDTRTQVTVYSSEGRVEDWAQLQTGRSSHACGHFVNTDNQVVRQQHSSVKLSIGFTIADKAPTSASTFKTLLRHNAQMLTPHME